MESMENSARCDLNLAAVGAHSVISVARAASPRSCVCIALLATDGVSRGESRNDQWVRLELPIPPRLGSSARFGFRAPLAGSVVHLRLCHERSDRRVAAAMLVD